MKKILPVLFLCIFTNIYSQFSQTVQSTCVGPDSIKTKYRKDACRLAIRRAYTINSNYKDSILPQKTWRADYLKSLIAVYNATALPVRDTIIKLLNIHTNPVPELNAVSVKATGTLNWMQNLLNATVPVGNIFVDFLMTKYYLYPGPYYQSGSYDLAVLRSDSCLNTLALAKSFTTIPGVIGAEVTEGNDDSKDIKDSITPNYIQLTYAFGWGTCNNGCDYKISWRFKIFNDCVVEYLGSDGDPLNTSIYETYLLKEQIQIYPNPVNEKLTVDFGFISSEKVELTIHDFLGRLIYTCDNGHEKQEIDTHCISSGIYYLKVNVGLTQKVFKILKN